MASTLTTVSIVALTLGVAFLIAAAVIFVKLKIWIVMADLSGKTAQISIEQLRNQDGNPAKRTQHRSYVVNSGVLKRNKSTDVLAAEKTELIGRKFERKTEPLKKETETVPLKHFGGTEKLKPEKAETDIGTVSLDDTTGTVPLNEATEILDKGTAILNDGTAVLDTGATTVIGQAGYNPVQFKTITDIVMIHTEEKISIE